MVVPERFTEGVTLTVLLAPEPEITMLLVGTKLVLLEDLFTASELEPLRLMLLAGIRLLLLEALVTVSALAEVSTSETVKLIFPVLLSSSIVLFEILEMVGVSLTAFTVTTKDSEADWLPLDTVRVIVAVPD